MWFNRIKRICKSITIFQSRKHTVPPCGQAKSILLKCFNHWSTMQTTQAWCSKPNISHKKNSEICIKRQSIIFSPCFQRNFNRVNAVSKLKILTISTHNVYQMNRGVSSFHSFIINGKKSNILAAVLDYIYCSIYICRKFLQKEISFNSPKQQIVQSMSMKHVNNYAPRLA